MRIASITARRPPTVAMGQMVNEKLRDDRLVDPDQIEPVSLRPSQEMGRIIEVSARGVPGVTALDQISIEGVGVRLLRRCTSTPFAIGCCVAPGACTR